MKKVTFNEENLEKNKKYIDENKFTKITEPKTPKPKTFEEIDISSDNSYKSF